MTRSVTRLATLVLISALTIAVAACGASPDGSALASDAGALASGEAAASALGSGAVPATPSAKPSIGTTAKPSAAVTAKPTATPTAKPTAAPTPKPTAAPTPKPTAVPTPTPVVQVKTCKTADGSITNTYPADWFTVTDVPEFACMFFDSGKIAIDVATGYPVAAIHIVPYEGVSFDVAFLAATDTKTWRSISKTPMTISGLPAFLIVAVANGSGSYPRDTERYGWLVDRGANGVVVLQTSGPEDDVKLDANKLVLDGMAKKIVITP